MECDRLVHCVKKIEELEMLWCLISGDSHVEDVSEGVLLGCQQHRFWEVTLECCYDDGFCCSKHTAVGYLHIIQAHHKLRADQTTLGNRLY